MARIGNARNANLHGNYLLQRRSWLALPTYLFGLVIIGCSAGDTLTLLNAAKHRLRLPYTVSWDGDFIHVNPWQVDSRRGWQVRQHQWEAPEVRAGLEVFDWNLPLIEFGGGLGVTAVKWNRHCKGNHYVVEPSTSSCELLTKQRKKNGCTYFVLQGAIGPYGTVKANTRRRIATGRNHEEIAGKGKEIKVKPLEEWVRGPCNVSLDIEGGELQVIRSPALDHVHGLVIDWTERLLDHHQIRRAIQYVESRGLKWVTQAGNVSGFKR